MKKVIHMVTISRSLTLMYGQIEYLKESGYCIGVLSSPGKELDNYKACFKKSIKMEREINMKEDIKSLIKLIKYFRVEKPYIVNAGTPKAGLLGIIASFVSRVPNRVYTMRGLRLETETGLKRKILWWTEKISCLLATEVICISPSLLKKAKELNILNRKGVVLNRGSSNGVNVYDYPLPQNKKILKFRNEFMTEHNINRNEFVLGFVGRITEDKGVNELISVFKELESKYKTFKLVIIGELEDNLDHNIKHYIYSSSSIIYLGYIKDPAFYFYLFDVLLFPTHREGFGNVSIQAQAASVPVITTNVTGAVDTVLNNETGIIYPVNNNKLFKLSILYFYENPEVAKIYGSNGRRFVEDHFQSKLIWEKLSTLYEEM